MRIPLVSGWWARRRARRHTREVQAAVVAYDMTCAQAAGALSERVLPETVASVEQQRCKTDTIIRAAAVRIQAASGSFPPRNGIH